MEATAEVGDLEVPALGISVGVSDDLEAPGSEYAEVEVPRYASCRQNMLLGATRNCTVLTLNTRLLALPQDW